MTSPLVERDERHNYRVADGPWVPSVTTVVAATTRDGNLIPHTRRQAIEFTIEHSLLMEDGLTSAQLADQLETEATRAAEADARYGDMVHAMIEEHIAGKRISNEAWVALSAEGRSSMRQFYAFENAYRPKYVGSEVRFVDECHQYGGTIDAWGRLEGMHQRWVWDWKTGSRTRHEHILQLSAYQHWLNTQGHGVRSAAIVHLAPGEPFKFDEIELTSRDFDAFLHSLEKYRWMKERAL